MKSLSEVAPAFVEVAHRIVWCTTATVDDRGRPRSRVLHPFWSWDGHKLVGYVATAECSATWHFDDDTRRMVWDLFLEGPEPVGYDPAIIPGWEDGPLSPAFAALRLEPWRLRVFPGSVLFGQGGEVLDWRS